jgi:hypothetical protein
MLIDGLGNSPAVENSDTLQLLQGCWLNLHGDGQGMNSVPALPIEPQLS